MGARSSAYRSASAARTLHSSAADDDSPAPTGTSDVTTMSAPPKSAPASRNDHTTPATYPAHPVTAPGTSASTPNTTVSSWESAQTVHTGRLTRLAAVDVRCGNANGSTNPSV